MSDCNENDKNVENVEQAKRKLASIQIVTALDPIPEADRIEVATILGWKVVVKKGEFNVGDKCVYFEIDSLLPNVEWSKFLDKKGDGKAIRLKTIKLKGQISQGLALPVGILTGVGYEPRHLNGLVEGSDMTEALRVEKYEPYIPAELVGVKKGAFPHFLRKTDELRIQSYPDVIEEFKGRDVVVTLKMDGTSGTYYVKDGEFGVCSRNMELKENDTNKYWQMARQLGLKDKMLSDKWNFCIQGELCGPGIQANRMGFKENKLLIYNVWDIDAQRYQDDALMPMIVHGLGLELVPTVYVGPWKWNTVEELLAFADEQNYPNHGNGNDSPAEGIVIRPVKEALSTILGGRLSIKAISNRYLVKYG